MGAGHTACTHCSWRRMMAKMKIWFSSGLSERRGRSMPAFNQTELVMRVDADGAKGRNQTDAPPCLAESAG